MLKRLALGAVLSLVMLVPVASVGATPHAAAVSSPTHQTGGQRFLTLPFTDRGVNVQQGFMYTWGSQHSGTDYVLGARDTGRWQHFDVVAAADGWACGNCTSRQGNAVWIRHLVNGMTYYTYYGHLDSIEDSIPQGSQSTVVWVQRGQKLGVSGSTGADSIHLHFQVALSNSSPVDPYDLWTTREPYAPGCTLCQMGDNDLWTTNPPSMSSGAPEGTPAPPPPAVTPPPASTPLPANTPVPTPTKPSCNLEYGKSTAGKISDAAPEVSYCLKVTAPDAVSIRMFAAEGTALDSVLKVYAPDGKLLATDDDGAQVDSNSFLVTQLPAAGTYTVVAGRYSGEGAFHIRVDKGARSALGDLNADCVVNSTDQRLMVAALNSGDLSADINLDGVVNADDQLIQTYRLGRGCMLIKH